MLEMDEAGCFTQYTWTRDLELSEGLFEKLLLSLSFGCLHSATSLLFFSSLRGSLSVSMAVIGLTL